MSEMCKAPRRCLVKKLTWFWGFRRIYDYSAYRPIHRYYSLYLATFLGN